MIKYEITEAMYVVIIAFIKVYIQAYNHLLWDVFNEKTLFPKWYLGRGSNNVSFFRILGLLILRTTPAVGWSHRYKDIHLTAITHLLLKESK